MATTNPERPVRHLQQLYTVVIGLSLTVAINNLLEREAAVPIKWPLLPYFIAYLVTLVPFYHGALRHLDITYLEDPNATTQAGALLADWGLLFLESCFLLALAVLIQQPEAFCYGLIVLLCFDILWAFAAHLAFSANLPKHRIEWRWALINIVTSAVLVFALVYFDTLEQIRPIDNYRWRTLLTVTILRSISDYWWCWAYYFPPIDEQTIR